MELDINRLRRKKGFAIIMTTLTLTVTIPAVGLAIDVGTLYLIRSKLFQSVDAAVLAGARALGKGPDAASQTSNAQAAAQNYFNANFQDGYWNTSNKLFATPTVDGISVPNYRTVTASASVRAPLYFLRIFGQTYSTVNASAQASRRDALVMLVLDRSSSMNNTFQGQTACSAMKTDAAQFVNNFAQGRDMVGLVIFGASTFSYAPTTSFATLDVNGNTVQSLIGQISCGGNTNTSQGLNQAYGQLQAVNNKNRANVIVLMTDGRPNGFTADFISQRINPGSCAKGSITLVGAIAQWAGGPKDTGPTAGIMKHLTTSAATSSEVPTPGGVGCQFTANLTNLRNDISSMPSSKHDSWNNNLDGPYSVQNPNAPYNNLPADLSSVSVPKQIILASTNAADNQGTAVRTGPLKPEIYVIALEGNDPNDPPDTLFLRKLANDPAMESDADPTARTFYLNQVNQTHGFFVDAPDPSQLSAAFNAIAAKIVVRLSR